MRDKARGAWYRCTHAYHRGSAELAGSARRGAPSPHQPPWSLSSFSLAWGESGTLFLPFVGLRESDPQPPGRFCEYSVGFQEKSKAFSACMFSETRIQCVALYSTSPPTNKVPSVRPETGGAGGVRPGPKQKCPNLKKMSGSVHRAI